MYNILYIYCVQFFYEDNNRILVIFSMWLRKIDVAKSVNIIIYDHSIEIKKFVCDVQNEIFF